MSTSPDERSLIVENAQREEAYLAAKAEYFADPDAPGAFEKYRAIKVEFGEWRRSWRAIRDLVKLGTAATAENPAPSGAIIRTDNGWEVVP